MGYTAMFSVVSLLIVATIIDSAFTDFINIAAEDPFIDSSDMTTEDPVLPNGRYFLNTDIQMNEIETEMDIESSIEERKGCPPTSSCTQAGGTCIKSKKTCTGKVDPKKCKGKKCTCCIPDMTTPAPPTCPPKGSNLTWISVGFDRFVQFNEKMSWTDARALCQSHGLDIYQPRDILAVSEYLDDNFSDTSRWHWLGGKGNGTHQVWLSGGVLTRSDPWYSDYYTKVAVDICLYFITHSGWSDKGTVLATIDCKHDPNIATICG